MSAPSVVEDVFLAALEKSTAGERAAFLDAACKDDPTLRRRVERLLEAHPKAGGFLEGPARPAGEETAAHVPTGEAVGTVIAGRYKLLEQIGEGGMGAVWLAEQTQPIRRKVALKLIKAGMDSKTVLSRFEAERQALALMDHPNIAKVLDGGTTEVGRPFFVMEYVKGVPFIRYCDDARLSVAQRLALFVPVCQAVQHAHQKGIIHRDLKPSNILVCLYDGVPVPKVIDFGLAKAMHRPLTEHTLHTAHGVMMGTPLYMSPEQAEFNNLDVDTRTDIYALGVMLYELLTGTTPLEKQRFQEAAWHEMLRLIKEEEPPRPSARLSGSRSLPALAAQRQLEPIKLPKLVRGELDWIVMKCLEKDRSRRYETATGLARDLNRYLHDEVVEARPPTPGYRLRKLARKHRLGLVTASAFAGLLIAAATVSGWLAVKARLAEALADQRRIEAQENASRANESADSERQMYNKAIDLVMEAFAAKGKIEHDATGLRVDLDLAEMRVDRRLGILQLAKTLKTKSELIHIRFPNGDTYNGIRFPSEKVWLNEFINAALLATGQDYAPLLPPISHDGHRVIQADASPDGLTLLTRGDDFTARLWDSRTARSIAVLREGTERVVNSGFSPDGRTVFTDDLASVARFWDVPDGRYRAQTESRPNRYVLAEEWSLDSGDPLSIQECLSRAAAQIGPGRLLTKRFNNKGQGVSLSRARWEGPVELWDAATGRLLARFDAPGRAIDKFQSLGKRWITTVEGSTLLVFSAEDGCLLARLNHPAGEVVEAVDVGPSGRKVATLARTGKDAGVDAFVLRVWDTETWRAEPVTTPLTRPGWFGGFRFWTDEPSGGRGSVVALAHLNQGIGPDGWTVYRSGQSEPIVELIGNPSWPDFLAQRGDLAHDGSGHIYDTRNWQRLLPPPGRRFHPDLARFAPDERFVRAVINGEQCLIDTRTDKSFPMQGDWGTVPSFGMITAVTTDRGATIRLIPLASRLDLPADLLELWAQVAVRGEIGRDGQFAKWDEPAWEKKRQELAAKPAPYSDFPFPGHVATDKLHWLRAEFDETTSDADKLRLARELLRRAEEAGDRDEAVRWRAEVDRHVPAVAPPPRPVKP